MGFNWSDGAVLGIIALFAFVGFLSGFILSVFRIASYFVAIIVSVKYYPVVANFLMETSIFANVKMRITDNIRNLPALSASVQAQSDTRTALKNSVGTVIDGFKLPNIFKEPLLDKIDLSKIIDFNGIIESLGGGLAEVVVNIISLVLLFIAVRFGLVLLKLLLSGVVKLPILKQLDKVGGLAFGTVEGFLMVYLILAALMLFQTMPAFSGVFTAIDNSAAAKFFYNNNFIINWML